MKITIEALPYAFTVAKVGDYRSVGADCAFVFTGRTDEECSLVCKTEDVPENTIEREDGWRAFRIVGTLDFSLIGILSGISSILAGKKIGIFALSTFHTDYILTKSENFAPALDALREAGYEIVEMGEAKPG